MLWKTKYLYIILINSFPITLELNFHYRGIVKYSTTIHSLFYSCWMWMLTLERQLLTNPNLWVTCYINNELFHSILMFALIKDIIICSLRKFKTHILTSALYWLCWKLSLYLWGKYLLYKYSKVFIIKFTTSVSNWKCSENYHAGNFKLRNLSERHFFLIWNSRNKISICLPQF